jgi:putative ABC transport system substrate-binding protein
MIRRRAFVAGMAAVMAGPLGARAQQPARVYRVGVVMGGGPYLHAIDGLRDGLKDLGLEERRDFVLHVRDTRGDLKAVEAAAKSLEAEKVDVLYALATSVTLAAKRATSNVPIVFYAGSDPVAFGLVESFRRPGGRLTGIHGQFVADLAPKRLQLLKEMLPHLRRVVTFYNPNNPAAQASVKLARAAARDLNVDLAERPVTSVEALQVALRALRPEEAEAFFYVADAMMQSQVRLIIDEARARKLPTMLADAASVSQGALAGYGVSYYAVGRASAKHVQRVLLGAAPSDLPVEQLNRVHFAINLKTARALNLTIPPSLLLRADQVIE